MGNQVFPIVLLIFQLQQLAQSIHEKIFTYFQNIFTLGKKNDTPHPEPENKSKESVICGNKIFDIL